MEKVTKMLDEVHSKLRTEVKVAMYELDQRYQEIVDQVNGFVN